MAILPILEFPDPRLRTRAQPVTPERLDAAFAQRVADMFETMYAAPGVGLAATQVNDHRRFMVIDVSEHKDQPLVFVNPEIVAREGSQTCQEGCLSVPGIYADVERAERIRVRALDRHGRAFELEADGLLAVCIQHEIDHLDGKVFVDYLSPFKREQVRRKLDKQRREREADSLSAAPRRAP
jgi:peptide deformylase